MSYDPRKNKVADFLLEKLTLFGTEENSEVLRAEIRRAAIMLKNDQPYVGLNMSVEIMTENLANPPVNDIDSDVGNWLGKIFKSKSKNIPLFEKYEHAKTVATIINGLGDLACYASKRTLSEQKAWIGFYSSAMERTGALYCHDLGDFMESVAQDFARLDDVISDPDEGCDPEM